MQEPRVNAALTALAVFMVLYLSVGSALHYPNWWRVLIWPFTLYLFFLWVALVVAAFAAVAYYVYRLKLRLLAQSSAKLGAYIARAGEWQDKTSSEQAIEAARKEADSRIAAAEQAARLAVEGRNRAEKRLADLEANARPAVQIEKPPAQMKSLPKPDAYSRVCITLRM
jgi:hypothetical protein